MNATFTVCQLAANLTVPFPGTLPRNVPDHAISRVFQCLEQKTERLCCCSAMLHHSQRMTPTRRMACLPRWVTSDGIGTRLSCGLGGPRIAGTVRIGDVVASRFDYSGVDSRVPNAAALPPTGSHRTRCVPYTHGHCVCRGLCFRTPTQRTAFCAFGT